MTEIQELQRHIRDLVGKGFIQQSASSWGTPVLSCAKKDGGLRLCIDYRALNKQMVRNTYPLLRIDDIFDNLRKALIFTFLDLHSGCLRARIEPNSVPLTAFRNNVGPFEFPVLPCGLNNAPAAFIKLVNDFLQPFIHKFAAGLPQ